jgi:hypothetical protein
MKCEHCGSEKIYLFAIINGKEVYNCCDCNKRTRFEDVRQSIEQLRESKKWKGIFSNGKMEEI